MPSDQRCRNSQGRALGVLRALRLGGWMRRIRKPNARPSELCFTSPSDYTWRGQLRIGDGCEELPRHSSLGAAFAVADHQSAISCAFFRLRAGPGEEHQRALTPSTQLAPFIRHQG